MKNKIHLAPVIFIALVFISSCGRSGEPNAKKSGYNSVTDNSPQSSADSIIASPPPADKSNRYASSELHSTDNQNAAGNYPVTVTETNGATVVSNAATYDWSPNSSAKSLETIITSSAARATRLDSTHRFIRTADLKFRVKNVAGATYRIEDITTKFKGYVADTKLTSEMQSSTEIPVSKDSSLETMRYIVTNAITLRIPSENMDTTLKCLVPLIDYLDYRNINMRDITLDLLSNKLAQDRLGKYNARLSNDIDTKGKKLDDVQNAEQSILNSQENSNNAMLENLRQDDQVRYSTVTILLYQRETIRQELVKREQSVDAYEPGLGAKMKESLSEGWHGLQEFLMVIVILWPLWLIGIFTYVFVKWLVKKNKVGKIN